MKIFRHIAFIFTLFILFESALYAQWIQTNSPSGGRVNCFAVSGTNLFAGTKSGGVFRSTNNGTNWTAVNNGLSDTQIYTLAVFGSELIAGTPYGIFLSTNNGSSWSDASNGLSNYNTFAFAVSGSMLFAGTLSGVYRSMNGSASWSAVNSGFPGGMYIIALAVSGNHLFAGDWSLGVFHSTNSGASWTAVNSGLSGNHVPFLSFSGTNLFAGDNKGVFLSTNYGASWADVNTGMTFDNVESFLVSGANLFTGTSDDFFGDAGGVFQSTTNGRNWTAINTGLPNTAVFALAVSGTNLFAGTNDGVWRRPLSELTSAAHANDLPSAFNLEQNYPNPFPTSAAIKFQIPSAGDVTLRVFNALGREVTTLVNEQMQPGSYEKSFDASGLGSGVYFYRLQSGSFTESRKLVLQR
jgi:hypothetical protein